MACCAAPFLPAGEDLLFYMYLHLFIPLIIH